MRVQHPALARYPPCPRCVRALHRARLTRYAHAAACPTRSLEWPRICRGSLHAKLREKLVQGLRAALPAEKQGLVFLQGGQAAAFNLYSSDMERLFL